MPKNEITREVEYLPLPSPVPGGRRELTVFSYGAGTARPKAYLQAGLHAGEHPGMLVMHHLLTRLDDLGRAGRIKGRIVLAPLVNPIGVSQFINHDLVGRFDLFGGNNFNRNFPRLAEKAAARLAGLLDQDSERNQASIRDALREEAGRLDEADEADALRVLITRLAVDADIALDLHADGQSLLHLYTHPIHRDLAEELAAQLGAPVTLLGVDRAAHSLDDALNLIWLDLAGLYPGFPIPHGCFAATVELRGRSDVSDDLASRDADNLLRFLMRRGVIDGDPGPLPALIPPGPTPLAGVEHGRAPAGGVAVFAKKIGDWVKAGEVAAEVVDPTALDPGEARFPIASRIDGVLFSINLVRLVRRGQIIFKVAGRESIKKPGDRLLED
ncbi:MAG: succinylglutamate desuccinylase/aspartoacylase family protein [Pseudomonadota bacterium]